MDSSSEKNEKICKRLKKNCLNKTFKKNKRILASFSISVERRDREVGVESVMDRPKQYQ